MASVAQSLLFSAMQLRITPLWRVPSTVLASLNGASTT